MTGPGLVDKNKDEIDKNKDDEDASSPKPIVIGFQYERSKKSPTKAKPIPIVTLQKNVPIIKINVNDWPIELRLDEDELYMVTRSTYVLGQTPLLQRLGQSMKNQSWKPERRTSTFYPRLESDSSVLEFPEHTVDSRPFEKFFQGAQARLWKDLGKDLKDVEQVAISIIQQRLQLSRIQIRKEAKRYLTGYDENKVFGIENLEWSQSFPPSTKLLPGPEMEQLRKYLTELKNLKDQADKFLIGPQRTPTKFDEFPTEKYGKAVEQHQEFVLKRLQRVFEISNDTPIIHWILDYNVEKDEDLVNAIVTELQTAWRASLTVGEHLEFRPASSLGYSESSLPYMLADILRNRDRRGPWHYPLIIEEALRELGWTETSVQTIAVNEVFKLADPNLAESFAQAIILSILTIALLAVCPPIGVAFGILTGLWDLSVARDDYIRKSVDYHAILDINESLARPPNLLPVVAAVIGAVSPGVPGKSGLALDLIGVAAGFASGQDD